MTFTNISNILDLGKTPLLSKDRTNDNPLIIAGGPCVYNSEPLADFVDVFIIGDGEEIILELLEEVKKNKDLNNGQIEKESLLKELLKIQGLYIPVFYDAGDLGIIYPVVQNAPCPVTKRTVDDLDQAQSFL